MNDNKKKISLHAMVALPITVGKCAILFSGGNIIRTSQVVAIHQHTPEQLRFETLNTHYCVSMDPFPLAAVSPLPVSAAA